ncbi:hypothetical protein BDN70DRAFT_295716 [Pholiota conissans]|uniref:Uncharacterized protein n=1 Tax=Pholiota conissans TaxID=109636 RepID=A0A9P5YS26_9AGAR|nr:hypothetical protein BDN70DRAFT_295716 [Pholiota conissans]
MPAVAYLKDQFAIKHTPPNLLLEAVMEAVRAYNFDATWNFVIVSALYHSRDDWSRQEPAHLTARAFDKRGNHRGAIHLFTHQAVRPTFWAAWRVGHGGWKDVKFGSEEFQDRLVYIYSAV